MWPNFTALFSSVKMILLSVPSCLDHILHGLHHMVELFHSSSPFLTPGQFNLANSDGIDYLKYVW